MIALRMLNEGERAIYVALWYWSRHGHWAPLGGEHEHPLDAGKACLTEFMQEWHAIGAKARTLRALCEHPNFADFAADGIDAATILQSAQLLAQAIEVQNDNIERLLDEPRPGDLLRFDDGLFEVNAQGQLEPFRLETSTHGDQDSLFLQAIHKALIDIRSATGQGVTAQGFDDAVCALLLMHPTTDDLNGTANTDQLMADRLYGRLIAASLHRVYQLTGGVVSERGLDEAAHYAARVRNDLADQTPKNGAQVIPFPQLTRQDEDEGGGDDNGGDES